MSYRALSIEKVAMPSNLTKCTDRTVTTGMLGAEGRRVVMECCLEAGHPGDHFAPMPNGHSLVWWTSEEIGGQPNGRE